MTLKMALEPGASLSGPQLWRTFIGITLAASGIARLILAFRLSEGRAWMILSGLISIAAAVLVAVSWPWSSLWLLGMVLAIDLMSQGVMLMLFGFSLRSAASVQ
jgi:uncharacterized membrane protein HdeD (DUF308 family)